MTLSKTTKTVDATKPLRIVIQREDVAQANAGDDNACAVAQAMLRRKGVVGVSIGATTALVLDDQGVTTRYVLDRDTQALIRAFDDSDIFPLVGVTLRPPNPGQRLGDRVGEAHGTNVRSGKANTVARHLTRMASRHVHRP